MYMIGPIPSPGSSYPVSVPKVHNTVATARRAIKNPRCSCACYYDNSWQMYEDSDMTKHTAETRRKQEQYSFSTKKFTLHMWVADEKSPITIDIWQ